MPIFNFLCNKCKKNSKLLLFSKDIPECEYCKSTDLTKLPSRISFLTKSNSSDTESGNHSSSCSSCNTSNCSSCGCH